MVLDRTLLNSLTWTAVTGTDYSAAVTSISPGFHELRHQSGSARFAAFLYGIDNNVCAYSFAAGSCFEKLTEVSQVFIYLEFFF